MRLPLQITFRHMEPSPALAARIRRKAAELDQLFERITACRVVVECRHKHHRLGNLFEIHIDLDLPGSHIVAGRNHPINRAHEDVHAAVRDAFDAARRRLEDHLHAMRGDADYGRAARRAAKIEPA